ncbi:MAG: deoxyribodipyrimidine photo-lyase [Burkholderiaceae bacterium]
MNTYDKGLMWFRRDLRAHDNAALHHALRSCRQVWCIFVFDTDILEPLQARGLTADRRVEFIRESLFDLDQQLRALGQMHGHAQTGLIVRHARSREEIPQVAGRLGVQAVFANHDDDPAAKARDAQVLGALAHHGIMFHGFKDHVVFERRELLTQAGGAFGVFTPYRKAWLRKLTEQDLEPWPVESLSAALAPIPGQATSDWHAPVPRLSDIGFTKTNLAALNLPPGSHGAHRLFEDFVQRIDRYHDTRDFPAVKGPSYLGVHLRFGTISIRQVASVAYRMHLQGMQGAGTWLSELIWRDFYHQILANFPHVAGHSFKPEYDQVRFDHGRHGKALFEAWCEGRTGYPLVDAAMNQLHQSGYMHNRLRMVTASFLVKDLGVDWRWGEAHFADHLIDYELASNNGGWQWAASTGCDAQPWFRIFNPVTQSLRFDPNGRFIRRYLPQLAGLPDAAIHAPWQANEVELEACGLVIGRDYPRPLVDHAQAREQTLARYAVVRRPEPHPKA